MPHKICLGLMMALLVFISPLSADDAARFAQAKTVSAAFDNNGRLWLAWVSGQHLYINYSDDQGKSYSPPVKVNREPQKIAAHGESRPQIAVSGDGHIYTVYNQKLKKRYSGHVRFSRSTDAGKTFSAPVIVNSDQQMIGHSFGALALNNKGHIYIAWLDGREATAAKKTGQAYVGSSLYYTVSFDGGETFEPNIKLQDYSCQCCRIAIALDTHALPVIVWRQIFDETTRDHALIRFTEPSKTTPTLRASYDEWAIDSCPHHGPSLAIADDDSYHLTWFTGAAEKEGIYYAHSRNQGQTFSSPLSLGSAQRQAQHPYLLSSGQQVFIVWKEFDGETTSIQLLQSANGGKSWSEARTISQTNGASDHPFLIDSGASVYLSWQTAEGYRLLPLSAAKNTNKVQAFVSGTLAQIIAQYSGQAFIVSYWSIDCPPCYKELAMWSRLILKYPDLPIVLVSTDGLEQMDSVTTILNEFALAELDRWVYGEEATEKLRFEIDRQWYGELPRTYFYDASGQAEGISGLIAQEKVEAWIQQQNKREAK